MHNNQVKVITTFLEYIITQSQKEYEFDINDVTEAIINNNCLYIAIGNVEKVIMLYSKAGTF